MPWYIVHMDAGVSGTNTSEVFEADSNEEANSIGYDLACDHASSYFDVIEPGMAGEDGYDEDDHFVTFVTTEDISWSVNEYTPDDEDDDEFV